MKDEALKLALEALDNLLYWDNGKPEYDEAREAITVIREALAAPVQEPVAYPEGDVVGPCICGSWPGGKCLKCPRIAPPAQPAQEPNNFCPRCGKRLQGVLGQPQVHTCTPPLWGHK